jgi:hypothetical protein
MAPNPSIERTCYGKLRLPAHAAHKPRKGGEVTFASLQKGRGPHNCQQEGLSFVRMTAPHDVGSADCIL